MSVIVARIIVGTHFAMMALGCMVSLPCGGQRVSDMNTIQLVGLPIAMLLLTLQILFSEEFARLLKRAGESRNDEICRIIENHTGNQIKDQCPMCDAETFINKSGTKWCGECSWSNSKILTEFMEKDLGVRPHAKES